MFPQILIFLSKFIKCWCWGKMMIQIFIEQRHRGESKQYRTLEENSHKQLISFCKSSHRRRFTTFNFILLQSKYRLEPCFCLALINSWGAYFHNFIHHLPAVIRELTIKTRATYLLLDTVLACVFLHMRLWACVANVTHCCLVFWFTFHSS